MMNTNLSSELTRAGFYRAHYQFEFDGVYVVANYNAGTLKISSGAIQNDIHRTLNEYDIFKGGMIEFVSHHVNLAGGVLGIYQPVQIDPWNKL